IDRIIENLIYLHPLLSKSLTRSIRAKTNLNPGSLYILGLLSKYDVLSMSEIGCKLAMPKPHVTAQVDKLIAEDMVERLFDKNDRRIINIRFTEKGKEDFKAIKQEISRDMRERIAKLDKQKLTILSDATQQVRDILSEIMIDKNTTVCNKNQE
ncbi:MAG TPA: MarR family transcriptional regulator, partial [Paludibacter sp.]|nr:MarR family transcriptional regulator [Paludibacter sp.]